MVRGLGCLGSLVFVLEAFLPMSCHNANTMLTQTTLGVCEWTEFLYLTLRVSRRPLLSSVCVNCVTSTPDKYV